MSTLAALLETSPFLAYAYGYPHKTAYRTFTVPRPLAEVWRDERRDALFLYLHVPFCEQRCGFCNLYTQVEPQSALVDDYLAALERQARVVREQLGAFGVARVAVGGGTPTWLRARHLDRVFALLASLGAEHAPASVEASPVTADSDRVAVLRKWGVARVSIGVQSLYADETDGVGRKQRVDDVQRAIERLATAEFPTRNVDLMYGLPHQTIERLLDSIDRVIAWGANELYLYPLYVRPLTRLGRKGHAAEPLDQRLFLYRAARDHLTARGWQQRSLRMFAGPAAARLDDGDYRCQSDGMIGLGAGARSYTRTLHYAAPFATAQSAIRTQIRDWVAQSAEAFGAITHGVELDVDEQRRRYVILTLLERGLLDAEYRARFAREPLDDLPQLAETIALGLATHTAGRWSLTLRGIEAADVIGHWLYSPTMLARMATWDAQ